MKPNTPASPPNYQLNSNQHMFSQSYGGPMVVGQGFGSSNLNSKGIDLRNGEESKFAYGAQSQQIQIGGRQQDASVAPL